MRVETGARLHEFAHVECTPLFDLRQVRSPAGGHGNPFHYPCLENPHGQRGLAGSSPWSHKESDTTERLSTVHHNSLCLLGVPCGSAGKESACNVGDLGLVLGLGGFSGEGKGYLLQYSGLENSMDAKSCTQLSNFHFHGFLTYNMAIIVESTYLIKSL